MAWLLSQQTEAGAWPSRTYGLLRGGECTTALVVHALHEALLRRAIPRAEATTAALERGQRYLAATVDVEGAIGTGGVVQEYPVYGTALFALSYDGDVRPRLIRYLTNGQHYERWGWKPEDLVYGGWGFSGHGIKKPRSQRVDISQTSIAVEALARGIRGGSPVFERASAFLDRCQNLEATGDGGFHFTPLAPYAKTPPLKSKAGGEGAGRATAFASYGSATADGLLARLAVGEDPRGAKVTSAMAWLVQHFTANKNPGFPEGVRPPMDHGMVFYWRWRVAKALGRLEWVQPHGLVSMLGWREDLLAAVVFTQREDGSFANVVAIMKEDDPVIATAESLLTLTYASDR